MKTSLQKTCGRIGHNWGLYLLLLPSLILLIIFSYKPMYGVIIAFKDYKNSLGIVGSPWANPLFKHFTRFFNSFQCGTTIRNTLALSLYSMLVGFGERLSCDYLTGAFPRLLKQNDMRVIRFHDLRHH